METRHTSNTLVDFIRKVITSRKCYVGICNTRPVLRVMWEYRKLQLCMCGKQLSDLYVTKSTIKFVLSKHLLLPSHYENTNEHTHGL